MDKNTVFSPQRFIVLHDQSFHINANQDAPVYAFPFLLPLSFTIPHVTSNINICSKDELRLTQGLPFLYIDASQGHCTNQQTHKKGHSETKLFMSFYTFSSLDQQRGSNVWKKRTSTKRKKYPHHNNPLARSKRSKPCIA